jgi:tetratricopeptide (TPR) repeat protein
MKSAGTVETHPFMQEQLTEDEIASMNARFAEAQAAYEAGRYAEAFARFEEMVAFARESLPLNSLALALHYRGLSAVLCGEYAIAVPLLREAVENYRSLDNQQALAQCLYRLGQCVAISRQIPESRRLLAESRDLYDRLGMAAELAAILNLEGGIAFYLGKHDDAFVLLIEARRRAVEAGDRDREAEALVSLSDLEITRGRIRSARKCLEDALGLVRASGTQEVLMGALLAQGRFEARWGAADAAESALLEALERYKSCGNRRKQADCHLELAAVDARRNSLASAKKNLATARELFRANGAGDDEASTRSQLGFVQFVEGDYDGAACSFREALAVVGEAHQAVRAEACLGLAASERMTGQEDVAQGLFAEARRRFERLGQQPYLAHVDLMEGETLLLLGKEREGEGLIRQGLEFLDRLGALNGVPLEEVFAGRMQWIRSRIKARAGN